jgi:signal transduction histidine kinase
MTKSMELEQLLFRQDKMASLGRVAAGIAHEIRNPLSGINIYLDALEKLVDRPDSRPKVVQVIDQLQSASRKIESVIRKVMDFAKPGKPNFVHIQINRPVEDALNLTAVTMRKSGIVIEKEFADNIPNCYADPHLIEEAVLNLINNAAEAMRKMDAGKKIAIRTGVTADHVFIKVSDSGPGVPMELKNKVFDPFFTTKNDGTGIGLSLCHRIVTDHKGVLSIDKGILGGAEFRLEIPIRKDAHSSD